jgi:hypothetical protein
VARRRPDFPIHRISESKREILARAPETQLDELLDAALTESVEGLRRRARALGPSGARTIAKDPAVRQPAPSRATLPVSSGSLMRPGSASSFPTMPTAPGLPVR